MVGHAGKPVGRDVVRIAPLQCGTGCNLCNGFKSRPPTRKRRESWSLKKNVAEKNHIPKNRKERHMSRKSLTYMIHELFTEPQNEEAPVILASIGKKIAVLELKEKELYIEFEDKTSLSVYDDGQSCCEYRYMTSDDDLQYFIGTEFMGYELKPVTEKVSESYGDVHEMQFLQIDTSLGSFTIENHNEHNGYYGGFIITVKEGKNEQ